MSKTYATEISTSTRSKSFSTPAHSPQLVTPISTPPHPSFAEQRLQQMLRNCEAGTHSFHRDDEDDYTPGSPSGPMAGQVSDMRRKSFAGGEVGQGQRAGRRPSFLSSLSLSRPFGGFTPSQPSSPATQPSHHHHLPSGLAMTTSSPNSIASSPVTTASEIDRAKSTPPHMQPQAQPLVNSAQDTAAPAMQMQRSKTQPVAPVKVSGFSTGFGFGMSAAVQPQEERRHFDPGREPKLLGLL